MENDWKIIDYIQDGYDSFRVEMVHNGMEFDMDVWIDNTYNEVGYNWSGGSLDASYYKEYKKQDAQTLYSDFKEAGRLSICHLKNNNEIYQDDKGNWFMKEIDYE